MVDMIARPAQDIACPRCGQPVEGYEMNSGRIYTVPGGNPFGGDGHIVLTGDDPEPRNLDWGSKVQSWPAGDVWRLTPCGDRVTRAQVEEIEAHIRG